MEENFENEELVLEPEFGLNSEQETDSSDEEAELLDSDDDVPLVDLLPLADVSKNFDMQQHVYRWRADRAPPPRMSTEFKGYTHVAEGNLENPIDYFKAFFSDEMTELIAEQTNLYSVQCDVAKGSVGTSKTEIERLLSVFLKMCIVQMPRYSMYWEAETRYSPIANLISRDRFKKLKAFLHFNDNSQAPGKNSSSYDKLYKIRPLLQMLKKNCLAVPPEELNSVDEQIIPFKGKSSLRRYLPKKPKKWGFKIFSRNGESGFCYDFEVEGAPDPHAENEMDPDDLIGKSAGNVVLRMCSKLPKNQNYKVFFDNYFTFPELLNKLKQWGMCAVGTIRQDRLRGCSDVLKSERELRKEGRGSFCGAVDLNTGITVVRWYDKKLVQLASNYAYTHPTDVVQRWSKKESKYVDVQRPQIVVTCNAGMGGVDLFDMFQALYRLHHKSQKGYMRFFFWALGTAVINAWCLYRRISKQQNVALAKQLDLLRFTCSVSQSLAEATIQRKGRGRPSIDLPSGSKDKLPRKAPDMAPQADIRTDATNHWPVHRPDRPRCIHCGEKTRIGCEKCRKGLCLTEKRNCFKDFHT